MFEAVTEGLKKLNQLRTLFGLDVIVEGGSGDYDRLLFSQKNLCTFMDPYFTLDKIHSFGMYYFLTRILQPLYVTPEKPRYDHPLNQTAFQIAKKIPEFQNIGHLRGFVWRKR